MRKWTDLAPRSRKRLQEAMLHHPRTFLYEDRPGARPCSYVKPTRSRRRPSGKARGRRRSYAFECRGDINESGRGDGGCHEHTTKHTLQKLVVYPQRRFKCAVLLGWSDVRDVALPHEAIVIRTGVSVGEMKGQVDWAPIQ